MRCPDPMMFQVVSHQHLVWFAAVALAPDESCDACLGTRAPRMRRRVVRVVRERGDLTLASRHQIDDRETRGTLVAVTVVARRVTREAWMERS